MAEYSLECTKCGDRHPIAVQNSWGAHPGTQGLGPRVVCPSVHEGPTGSGAVCRGMLVAVTAPAGHGG